MSKTIKIGGKEYRRKEYHPNEIITHILPKMYGASLKDITYEQLLFIKVAMNDGWKLIPGYYGVKNDFGTELKSNCNWFSFIGYKNTDNFIDDGKYDRPIYQYEMCVNYNKCEINLYNSTHLIGTFPSYVDMKECFGWDKFYDMIPAKITACVENSADECITFEDCGCQFNDESFNKDDKVYNADFIKNFEHGVDYDSLECLDNLKS